MRSRLCLAGFRSTRRPSTRCAHATRAFARSATTTPEAQRALKHWEAAGQAAPERVAEYREIVKELEAEALAILEAFQSN
jgi:hypothetical protein